MKPLAEKALEAVRKKEITFIPDNYEKIFTYWMENTFDWNISRQIVWGIPIPAKVCTNCNKGFLDTDKSTKCPDCGSDLKEDTDTFDTWFSSGQWPLIALDYPNGKDFKTYHPTNVMETGRDLIFKWVPRMVIFSLYLKGEVPFKTVYLHGLANDAKGQKMSKSKGNGLSPITLSDTYGADALRMSLAVGNTPGSDFPVAETKILAYKKFANKLWNVTRFILGSLEDFDGLNSLSYDDLTQEDRKILDDHNAFLIDVTKDFQEYRFHLASEKIYHHIWHTIADVVIEDSKLVLTSENKKTRQHVLATLLRNSITVLHPFMPFITEELWALLPKSVKMSDNMLIVQKWPVQA
jgi:valyl-tRNA synthetase